MDRFLPQSPPNTHTSVGRESVEDHHHHRQQSHSPSTMMDPGNPATESHDARDYIPNNHPMAVHPDDNDSRHMHSQADHSSILQDGLTSIGEYTADDDEGGMSLYTTTDPSVPDLMLLQLYCARAKAPAYTLADGRNSSRRKVDDPPMATNGAGREEAEASWQPVRHWLSTHTAEEVRAAVEQRGENGLTALHCACRNVPPLDVLEVLLSVSTETVVAWPDGFGWLPIHYACASGSSAAVIAALAEAAPASKTATDGRGRTPLHFALGDKPAAPETIVALASTGAARYPDDMGMLVCAHLSDEYFVTKWKKDHACDSVFSPYVVTSLFQLLYFYLLTNARLEF
jgi:hypothetical protein